MVRHRHLPRSATARWRRRLLRTKPFARPASSAVVVHRGIRGASVAAPMTVPGARGGPLFQSPGPALLPQALADSALLRRASPPFLVRGPHLQRLPPRPRDRVVCFCAPSLPSSRVQQLVRAPVWIRSAQGYTFFVGSWCRTHRGGCIVGEFCDNAFIGALIAAAAVVLLRGAEGVPDGRFCCVVCSRRYR